MDQAGRYLNTDNLQRLSKDSDGWKEIAEDIKSIEDVLGIKLGPKTKDELAHKKLTDKIYSKMKSGKSPMVEITKSAILRRSLG